MQRAVAWSAVVAATFTMTVSYVDRVTLAVLAPSVTEALHLTETQYGLLTSAFSFAYLFATPLAGWWIDRVGARRGLVGSVLAWSTVAALHALVPSFAALFALRIALGITEGPSFPGAAQTVQRVLPPEERARGFGVLFTGSSVGGMIAPLLAAALFALAGWRFAFVGTALIGLVWIPIWLGVTSIPEVRARLDASPDELAAPRPSLGAMLADPTMLRALASILAAAPVFAFVQAWGAKYLVRTFSVQQADVGDYLWLPPLVFDAGAVLFGDLASRVRKTGGTVRPLYAIGILLATSIAFLPYAHTPWQSMIVLGAAMAGGGAIYTITTAETLSRMPPGAVSFAGGLMACGQSVAGVIANPLIGWSVDTTGDYRIASVSLAIWVVPGALLWLVTARTAPR